MGGLRGTLFFQTDRGAAGEHVDPGPEAAHAGFQAVSLHLRLDDEFSSTATGL